MNNKPIGFYNCLLSVMINTLHGKGGFVFGSVATLVSFFVHLRAALLNKLYKGCDKILRKGLGW